MSERILIFSNDPKKLIYPLGFANLIKSKLGYSIVAITDWSEEIQEIAKNGIDELKLVKGKLVNEQYYEILKKECEKQKPKCVITASSSDCNDIVARLAGSENLPMFTEISELRVEERIILERKVLGGKAIARIYLDKDSEFACSVASKKLDLQIETSPRVSYIEEIPKASTELMETEEKKLSGEDISQAEIVIGVGRGFKSKEDLKLAEELAALLNAQVGASRPIAADYKWLPEDRWIGISGKTIRPRLYIAVGISGAPQHIGGILESKLIVAIDKDRNAPIFRYADYGIVADLYQFLPVLIERIKIRKK